MGGIRYKMMSMEPPVSRHYIMYKVNFLSPWRYLTDNDSGVPKYFLTVKKAQDHLDRLNEKVIETSTPSKFSLFIKWVQDKFKKSSPCCNKPSDLTQDIDMYNNPILVRQCSACGKRWV